MKQLRRVGICQDDLSYYYQAVAQPVLEYASPWWKTRFTKEQTKQLEDGQHHPLQVIFGSILYNEAHCACNISSLAERQHKLGTRFFQRIIRNDSNVLWYLLPDKRDVQLMTWLHRARLYPTFYARTTRYKNSFIVYGLKHFQWFVRCISMFIWLLVLLHNPALMLPESNKLFVFFCYSS